MALITPRNLTKGFPWVAGLLLATFSSLSHAHFPFCNCKLEAQQIRCEAGFSDGSGAEGVTVDLISYDEEIINHQEFDQQSKAHFTPYEGDFYILLDAGPGHTVEVDWNEIEGLSR